jgi:hypothetical protein
MISSELLQRVTLWATIVTGVILYIHKYQNHLFLTHVIRHKVRIQNRTMLDTLRRMEIHYITSDDIPSEFKRRIQIIHVSGWNRIKSRKGRCEAIIEEIKRTRVRRINSDAVVFDVLEASGSYLPSMHTDTEWNLVRNKGFQIWCLEYNHNSPQLGNMFLFHNEYLRRRYRRTYYYLRQFGDNVYVIRNCLKSENALTGKPLTKYVLEVIPVDTFVQQTKMFYLDIHPNDCLVFDKDVLHMSDYRDKSTSRKSLNFRVAYKKDGELTYSQSSCGYVNCLSTHIHKPRSPGMYDLISQ